MSGTVETANSRFNRRSVEIVGVSCARDAPDKKSPLEGYLVGANIHLLDGRWDDDGAEVDDRKKPTGEDPTGWAHEQPAKEPPHKSCHRQNEGGGKPANHDDVVCRDPEIDVGEGATRNDRGMSVDDQVIAAEKTGDTHRDAEKRCQDQTLAQPSPPDHLAFRPGIRIVRVDHAE